MFGTRVQRDKFSTPGRIDITVSVVPFRENVMLFDVTLDAALTMDLRVIEVVDSRAYDVRTHRSAADTPGRLHVAAGVYWVMLCYTSRQSATWIGCR